MSRLSPLALALCAVVAACGSSAEGVDAGEDVPGIPDAGPADPGRLHPLDDVVRMNQLVVKGTHNSYHVAADPPAWPDWAYTHAPLQVQFQDQAVRQVELDVHWSSERGWLVHHVPYMDPGTTCETLAACLKDVRDWSEAHPDHVPLAILIEPKDDVDDEKITGHYDELDAALRAGFAPGRVLTPDDVRGSHPTLREAIAADGWPTLGRTRGMVWFGLLDSGTARAEYLQGHPNLEGRVMFTRNHPEDPACLFLEFGHPDEREAEIRGYVEQGFIVRAVVDECNTTLAEALAAREAALRAGAQLLSGDHPVVGDVPTGPGAGYAFDLPGGAAAICNPVIAPAECRDDAL